MQIRGTVPRVGGGLGNAGRSSYPLQLRRSYRQGPELHPLRTRGEQAAHRTSSLPSAFIRHTENLLRIDMAINLKRISSRGAVYFLKCQGDR